MDISMHTSTDGYIPGPRTYPPISIFVAPSLRKGATIKWTLPYVSVRLSPAYFCFHAAAGGGQGDNSVAAP